MASKLTDGKTHDALKMRTEHCVCRQCGGQLTTSLVIYDIYGGAGEELYCSNCKKIEFGVEKEIYELATYYIENFQFNYFYDLEENDSSTRLNIAKVADMMSWLLKNINLLDRSGLKDNLPDYTYFQQRRKN